MLERGADTRLREEWADAGRRRRRRRVAAQRFQELAQLDSLSRAVRRAVCSLPGSGFPLFPLPGGAGERWSYPSALAGGAASDPRMGPRRAELIGDITRLWRLVARPRILLQ